MKSNETFLKRLPFLIIPGILLMMQSNESTFLGAFLVFVGLIPFFKNPGKVKNESVKTIAKIICFVLIAALAFYTFMPEGGAR